MKLIRKILKFIFWFLFIVIALAIILYLSAGKIIQHVAPEFISKITQTETALGEVDISLFSGRIGLNNLAIGNPAGFKDKNVLQLGKLNISFEPQSILSDKIIVKDVTISGVNISTELNAKGKTNITELLNNVNKFAGTKSSNEPKVSQKKAESTQSTPGKSVVVRDLTIKNSAVRAGIAGQMMEIPLPEIRQQNIGEKKKQSLADIVVDILNILNTESTKAVLKATKESLQKNIQTGKDTAKGLVDTFKNLF